MGTRRRMTLAVAGVAAGLLVGASFAWACQPQPHITLDPDSGFSGTTISVSGQTFQSGSVELRWSSAAGPLLGTTTGPEFTTQVTIPEAADGSYVIMGIQYEDNGDFRGQPARQTFVVTSPAPEPPPGEGKPADPPKEKPKSPPKSSAPPKGGSSPVPEPVPAPQTVTTTSGDVAFAGSVPASGPVERDRGKRPEKTVEQVPVVTDPKLQTAAGASGTAGLWSGLRSDDGPGPRLGSEVGSGGLGWQAVAGVAALGIGSVLLFAGFFVASIRRRRVPVRTEDR